MAEDDWYRGPEWDEDAQALFRKKLSRAREHKGFYLRIKAMAVSAAQPDAALELLEELIASDCENADEGHALKARVLLARGDIDGSLDAYDIAMGADGMGLMAPGVMDYAFLVGLHLRAERYERALGLLDHFDALAQAELGRPFARPFGGNAGAAFIFHALGREDEAVPFARAALEQALARNGPIPGHPGLGRVPEMPKAILDRLVLIAGIWSQDILGPRPDMG